MRRAIFIVVLSRTLIPGILIQLGFQSNQEEARLLNTAQMQEKLAQGIFNGLDNFFIQAANAGNER